MLEDYVSFATVAELLADTSLSYSNTQAGQYIFVIEDDYLYKVASSSASDNDTATAGGLKLYSLVHPGHLLTRAQAVALVDTSGISILAVWHGGVICYYEKDASGTALTSASGQKWSPLGGNATPAHWGGEPGDANDATTAVQAAFDWAAAQWDVSLGDWTAWVNWTKQSWRCTSGINVTGIRQPGFRFGNGSLFFDMTSGLGLECFGTNSLQLVEPIRIEGTTDPAACPEALFCIGRCLIGSDNAAISPAAKGTLHLDGCASKSQLINIGAEVTGLHIFANGNSVESDTAFSVFHTGHMQDTADAWGSVLTSAFVTLPGVVDSPFSNVLHHYSQGEYKRASHWNGTITNITLGVTTTVAFTSANTTQSGRMANGQMVYIPKGKGGGVVELEQESYAIASLTLAGDGLSGTLVLSGVDSTGYTAYSSGGEIWRKSGPFMFLGSGSGYSFGPQSYGLSYADKGIILHTRNSSIGDFRFDGQIEAQVKYPISIDVGTTASIIQGMDVKLLSASQIHASPFQTIGSATLGIRDLRLYIKSHATTFPLFTNGGNTTVNNADIRTPLALTVSGLSAFTGWVHTQSPSSSRLYLTKSLYVDASSGQLTMPDFAMSDKLFHDGDTNTAIRFPAADTFTVETAGIERMRVNSAGFVGLGTVNPSYSLDIAGATNPSVRLRSTGTAASDHTIQRYTIGGISASNFVYFGDSADTDAGILAYHHSDDSFRVTVNTAEAARITSAGNVGIGETAPDYKLDVNGTFGFTPGSSVTPADNGDVVFELTANTTLTIKAKGSDGVVRSGTVTLS